MANYLPVLLVSGSTNTIPDDSSLVTLPRGQVDYLSHDWQEEDVWRSWRNMTRQKNEITNGIRLENASWRTWWKQRNKLKTVSPETLNWLKDCDVTWLYGPLHTAVDWTSPPKPSPVPDSVDSPNPASAHDRLDLSTRPLPHKPILKHRSISQFLTSDFPPTSPIFSPVDSDEEHEASDIATKAKRPPITHTKSDTNIIRWAHNRTFRKDLPDFDSKTLPPSLLSPQAPSAIRPSISQDSNSSTGGSEKLPVQKKKHISFNTFVEQCIAIEKPKKNASGFFGPGNHNDEGVWIEGRSAYVDDDGYDEDDEDDDDYPTSSQWETGYHPTHAIRNSHSNSPIEEEDEDEDDDGIIEIRSSSSSSTYRQPKLPPTKKQQRSQSKVSTASSSSSASTSTTNSSASRSSTTANTSSPSSPNTSLSPSRRGPAATSHHSSKTSTSPGSQNYNNSLYRPSRRGPPLTRTPSDQIHVTIAPIAPTILKTTGAWAEGFGDEGASDDGFGWAWALNGAGPSDKRSKSGSSFGGDEGSHTNGGGSFGTGRNARGFNTAAGKGDVSGGDDAQASDGTPVELVYVPPFGSNYSLGLDEPDYPGEFGRDIYAEEEEEVAHIGETVYHHSASVNGSIGFGGASFGSSTPIPISSVPMVIIDPEAVEATITGGGSGSIRTQTIRHNKSRPDVEEEDAYDFFGGADLGEDYFYSRRGRGYERERGGSSPSTGGLIVNTGTGGYGYTERSSRDRRSDSRRTLARGGESAAPAAAEERQSRSRSRSQSRTPSPAFLVSPPTNTASVPPAEVVVNGSMGRRRGSSVSLPSLPGSWITKPDVAQPTSSSSDRLPPPTRGRQSEVQSSYTSGSNTQSRGRSSTRTSSSSSWERGSSLGSSPLGSLSPDGGRIVASPIGPSGIDAVLGGAAVLAGGGRVDRDREGKEREREKQRGRERRGRDRTSGKVLSASEVESLGREDVVGAIAQSPSTTSSDSASNNTTIMGAPVGASEEEEEPLDPELGYLRRAEEEQRRRVHPTPSNSPVVSMRLFDDAHTAASSVGTTTPTTASTPSHSSSELTSTSTAATSASSSPSTYTHTRTPSGISVSQPNGNPPTSSPAKLRPPPLIPSPPLPAKPSTSFAAVSSPHIAAIASPTSPTITMSMGAESSTIVGKAVDIVSSAGAFLGLWGGKEAEHHVAGQ